MKNKHPQWKMSSSHKKRKDKQCHQRLFQEHYATLPLTVESLTPYVSTLPIVHQLIRNITRSGPLAPVASHKEHLKPPGPTVNRIRCAPSQEEEGKRGPPEGKETQRTRPQLRVATVTLNSLLRHLRGTMELLCCAAACCYFMLVSKLTSATVALCQQSGDRHREEALDNVHKVTIL